MIKSVVSSIVNFWSSAFILPMSCLDTIESLCSAFLWSGNPNQTHKAKVKWEDLCYPKAEGGLGVRRLRDSVRVFALSLIWRLYTVSGSLWVSWVHHYLLRHSSFWDVRDDTIGSWIWRKILKMRTLAYQFIRVVVGDGRKRSSGMITCCELVDLLTSLVQLVHDILVLCEMLEFMKQSPWVSGE